ncbi:MAG: hypothetical protein LUE89_02755 [Clostridiales bacterium]|nr:hypothetical protein [Clostridiales bacterium]
MKNVSSTVTLNLGKISQLNRAAVRALEQTAEAVHSDLQQAQTMPFRSGNLQNESTFVDTSDSSQGTVRVVSSTAYARRLYYHPEYNFYTGENPHAGGEWLEPYTEGGSKADFAKNAFKTLYKKEAGV